MIKPPGYKDMCETCKGTGKTDFVFGIVKVECMACDGIGFHKAPPPAPPPRQPMNEITVNIKSEKKEVETVEDIKLGDSVRYIGDYKNFKGESGKVIYVGNGMVQVKTTTGSQIWNVENAKKTQDSPTKPSHYGKLDVFAYAKEHFTVEEVNAYHQITAIKYITRAGKKDGNPYEQDIKKAITHLQECLKGEEG